MHTADCILLWALIFGTFATARADEAPKSEADVLKLIESLGGSYVRDNDVADKPVIYVRLSATEVKDEHLKHLRLLPRVQILDIGFTTVTDKGLDHVKALPNLKVLQLVDAKKITDKGLSTLVGMKDLENLNIQGASGLTAKGIAAFKKAMPKTEVFE